MDTRNLSRTKRVSQKRIIPNPKEHKLVKRTLLISLLVFPFALTLAFLYLPTISPVHTDDFNELHTKFASIARIGFFFSVGLLPTFFLFKRWGSLVPSSLKQWVQLIVKLVRQWHVPVAIMATGLILIHASLAIWNEFILDGTTITGIVALFLLALLAYFGIKRYRKLDHNWHLLIGIAFVIMFTIHTWM